MQRVEVRCPRCNQVNVLNKGGSGVCHVCRAWLPSGNPALDRIVGPVFERISAKWWRADVWSLYVSSYLLHAFVGAGIAFILTIPMFVEWPGALDQPPAIKTAPLVLGAVGGLLLADRSRRRGTLIRNSRQR